MAHSAALVPISLVPNVPLQDLVQAGWRHCQLGRRKRPVELVLPSLDSQTGTFRHQPHPASAPRRGYAGRSLSARAINCASVEIFTDDSDRGYRHGSGRSALWRAPIQIIRAEHLLRSSGARRRLYSNDCLSPMAPYFLRKSAAANERAGYLQRRAGSRGRAGRCLRPITNRHPIKIDRGECGQLQEQLVMRIAKYHRRWGASPSRPIPVI